jgi:small subunit ribosomal protein S6
LAATTNREYELVLMLDPEIPEERREKIASEARERIESQGSLKHDTTWGMRKLAYEIRQRTEADYRLFRFETEGELLNELNHNLRIAEGVLRFRIFKVDPDSPAIVPPAPLASGAPTPPRGPRRQGGGREAPAAADESAEAPAEASEPAAEQAPEGPASEASAAPEADAAPEAPEAADPRPADEAPESPAEQGDEAPESPAEPGSEPDTDR